MQLMPETADYIAQKSGGTAFVQGDLATPQVNISYGSWYLRYLLDHYDGREVLALAAYNAGEGTVDEWAARASARGERFRAADHIPFPETRHYVQKVLDAREEYRRDVRARARAVSPAHRPLAGRGALVTGVSRRAGIGYAIAQRLRELGADVMIQGFVPHDEGQPWGADPAGVRAARRRARRRLGGGRLRRPRRPAPRASRPPRSRSATSTCWSPTTRCPATRTSRRSTPRRSTPRWP